MCGDRIFLILSPAGSRDSTFQLRDMSTKRSKSDFWAGHPCGHPVVIQADVQRQTLWSGPGDPARSCHFGADIHDPKTQTSMTGGLKNFGQNNFEMDHWFLKI